MGTATQAVEQSQYLTFFIAEEEYALSILRVKEIIQYEVLTHVPMTPPWIRGVINLRGSVVPVVDLAVKFGLPASPLGKTTCVVIVEVALDGERAVMGVLADDVAEVIDLDADSIEPPPPFGTTARVDYLTGMGKIGRKFALVLDIDRVLSSDEILATAAAAEAGTKTEAGGQSGPDAAAHETTLSAEEKKEVTPPEGEEEH